MDQMDKWVVEYRKATTRRKQNELYKKIRSIYLFKLYKKMKGYNTRHHDDIISNYDYYLLKCIRDWKGKNKNGDYCSFTTYAYPWLVRKPFSALHEGELKKQRREVAKGVHDTELYGENFDTLFDDDGLYNHDRDYEGY